jgi:arylsulfatase A-like enzyme/Flp pilus assembly protein TadD
MRIKNAARAAASLLLLSIVACKGDGTLPPPAAGTPVFLISIDTLRSDHLPVYGYKKVETPNIDAFRADAVLYAHAYSHYPLTLPSHASILTGLLPADHGLRDNTGYQLRPDVKTIGQIMGEHGYATGAAVSAFILRHETGIDRGFQFFDDSVAPLSASNRQMSTIQRDGADTEQVAADWIGKQTRPVFFLLHLYEPHLPYSAPEPYRSRYAEPYDGEIARADEIVGTFLKFLKERGLYDKSLIILFSDHGEGLNEHGEDEHGMTLYREAIQVPLLMKLPGSKFKGATIDTPVQSIDIVPTVLERTATKAPPLPGRSLATLVTEKSPARRNIYSETYYPRFHYGWADQHSLIDGEHHYIQSTRPELFNVAKDPAELKNVLDEDRRTQFAMKRAIEPLIREAAAPGPVDREEVAKLAALGYLGSSAPTKPGEILPDPKDHLEDVRKVNSAFALYHERRYADSLAVLEPLLVTNPRILDLWDLKSKALARLGRTAEAVDASKQGLRLSPNATHMAIDVATLQIQLGNFDDAEKHAELAAKGNPAEAHDLLARIWIEKKDLARAEAEARKSMAEDHERVAPLITLGRVQREQGKLDAALATLNEAVNRKKERQDIPTLFFLRGDVLARLGRAEEAERDFRKEIELFPEDPTPYKNLVLLLVAEERLPEATQLIRKLIADSPIPESYHAVCEVLGLIGDARGVKYFARQGLARYPYDRELRRLAG